MTTMNDVAPTEPLGTITIVILPLGEGATETNIKVDPSLSPLSLIHAAEALAEQARRLAIEKVKAGSLGPLMALSSIYGYQVADEKKLPHIRFE